MSHSNLVVNTLIEIADRDLTKAAERLAAANKTFSDAKLQCEMLEKYRADYMAKYEALLNQGTNINAMQNYKSFLLKLEQAIAGQQQIIESVRQQVKRHLTAWQECQKKKMSYEVLSERADKRGLQLENKRDQKMMDEYASRAKRFAHS